jgi:hypothetical protein
MLRKSGASPRAADPIRVVVCRYVATVAGSVLEAQSVHPPASVFTVGALVPANAVAL